jgi:large subunit ribosomal protein L15
MKLHELMPAKGSLKKRKRIGRGEGSGTGKTSGRGTKGQNARSGSGVPLGFEGGQMPLQRRIPKRGFTNVFKRDFEIINIKDLKNFASDATVNREALQKAGLVKRRGAIKLLAKGEISYPLRIKIDRVSQAAREKIESAGGTVEVG